MSEKTRLENGQETLAQVDGAAAANVMHSLADIAPDVGKYILERKLQEQVSQSLRTIPEQAVIK